MSSAPSRRAGRKAAYSAVTTLTFFVLVSMVLARLQASGLIDDFRQDDTVLYLNGSYLKVDPQNHPGRYLIMDPIAPTVVQDSFPIRKGSAFRLFITGESFVRGGHHISAGTPVLGYGTIADWTREILEMRFPSRRFQVINGGANGQNSFRVASIVDEMVNAEPDLVVVAMGNNEGLVPVPGVSAALNRWIVYRLLKKATVPEPPLGDRPLFPAQDLDLGGMQRNFEAHLDQIIHATEAKGVPLELATLPMNLMSISGELTPAQAAAAVRDDPVCAQADALLQTHQCVEALDVGQQCTHPFFLSIRAAACFRAAGDYEDERALLKAVVEVDPHGRTRPSFNESIREKARDHHLLLADLEKTMEERSPRGIPGGLYFIDHVHLTCMGYLPVARDIVDSILAAGLIHGAADEPLPSPTSAELLARYSWNIEDRPGPPELMDHARRVCTPDARAAP